MQTNVTTNNLFCLDSACSTTRLVTRVTPIIENTPHSKFETVLILPEGEGRKGEGGLRIQGYFKRSLPDKPLVTVITVVFNGVKHLENSILSVLNQTYDNVEYIIIDGGSTDGTLDILKGYEGRIDCWTSRPDNGIYDAMSNGIRLAKGDWLYFLGSDDVLLDSMATVAGYLKDEHTVYYGDVYYPGSHRVYDGIFTARKLMFKNISHQSMFFPRQLFSEYAFNLKYRTHADYELNLRLFCKSEYTFKYMPVEVAVYNDCDGASTLAEDSVFLADKKIIIREFFPYHLYALYTLRSILVGMLKLLGIKQLLKQLIKG